MHYSPETCPPRWVTIDTRAEPRQISFDHATEGKKVFSTSPAPPGVVTLRRRLMLLLWRLSRFRFFCRFSLSFFKAFCTGEKKPGTGHGKHRRRRHDFLWPSSSSVVFTVYTSREHRERNSPIRRMAIRSLQRTAWKREIFSLIFDSSREREPFRGCFFSLFLLYFSASLVAVVRVEWLKGNVDG